MDFKESIPPAYVAWRTGTKNRVFVPIRQAGNRFLGSFKALQIRALEDRYDNPIPTRFLDCSKIPGLTWSPSTICLPGSSWSTGWEERLNMYTCTIRVILSTDLKFLIKFETIGFKGSVEPDLESESGSGQAKMVPKTEKRNFIDRRAEASLEAWTS
jgi:hypothetical protein